MKRKVKNGWYFGTTSVVRRSLKAAGVEDPNPLTVPYAINLKSDFRFVAIRPDYNETDGLVTILEFEGAEVAIEERFEAVLKHVTGEEFEEAFPDLNLKKINYELSEI